MTGMLLHLLCFHPKANTKKDAFKNVI